MKLKSKVIMLLKACGVLCGLVVLQQTLYWGKALIPWRGEGEVVLQNPDPAAFFYTECPEALEAEKRIRERLSATKDTN
ncbi:MAG: hypothetical protein AAFY98_08635 [Verrucomicrobiota bacterium]